MAFDSIRYIAIATFLVFCAYNFMFNITMRMELIQLFFPKLSKVILELQFSIAKWNCISIGFKLPQNSMPVIQDLTRNLNLNTNRLFFMELNKYLVFGKTLGEPIVSGPHHQDDPIVAVCFWFDLHHLNQDGKVKLYLRTQLPIPKFIVKKSLRIFADRLLTTLQNEGMMILGECL